MTEGAVVVTQKSKKSKKFNTCPGGFYEKEMTREEELKIEEYVEAGKYRQAGSSLRK